MKRIIFTVLALVLSAPIASAKVPESEAQALKNGTLTPLGADKKANADGTIPAWDGGLKAAPAGWGGNGKRLVDPYADDKPLFTISAENLAQYKAKLTPGQLALFARYPKTYRMPVYPTRRSVYNAPYIYDATYQNALNSVLAEGSDAFQGGAMGVPFPLPKSGAEVIWNQKLKHSGYSFRRWNSQLSVSAEGKFTETRLREDNLAPYIEKGMTPARLNDLMAVYFLQVVKSPPRIAGTVNLALSPMDQKKSPQIVFQYNPGQKRVRRAPAVAYDAPDPGTDGLTTVDQIDMFNGPLDRYSWKLVGKKELYIPYNSYQLHSDQLKYKDLVRPGHLNPEHARYELHRVWVVEATLKQGTSHAYARRTFYQEEDSWSLVLTDLYDARGQLWRAQEAHTVMYYDPADPHIITAGEVAYDLQSGRYALAAFSNEADEFKHMSFPKNHFEQSNMEKAGGGG
ncbi:MAG TPA: DUF1329 domain-containing protein [Solimonas sp.]|nr:DUF1329 domain-containing protein [Solimonas sp.]